MPNCYTLNIINLNIYSNSYKKNSNQISNQIRKNILSNINLSVNNGKIFAIVGASGSGKSMLAHSILGILPKNVETTGKLFYNGSELTYSLQKKLRGREIVLIPQSINCLNPLLKIKHQLTSVNKLNKPELLKKLFERFELSEKILDLYPFQLSGGMARRVLIVSSLLNNSKLIIADEPTSGLHQKMAVEALKYLRELTNVGTSILLITHDIFTALKVSDFIAVFHQGPLIEILHSNDFKFNGKNLKHPYTKALWKALPQNDFIYEKDVVHYAT